MDNFFNSLSDIEREVLVYYLTDGDGCKSYNKTTKRVLSEKLTKNKISNKINRTTTFFIGPHIATKNQPVKFFMTGFDEIKLRIKSWQ